MNYQGKNSCEIGKLSKGEPDWITVSISDFPELPYPGKRPNGSWTLTEDREIHRLSFQNGSWVDLKDNKYIDLENREFIFSYGSNLNPEKMEREIRENNQLFPLIVLSAQIIDYSAVWCDARREKDRAVISTLVKQPGAVEIHGLIAATPSQLCLLDKIEGVNRGCYERERLDGITILESHQEISAIAYLGAEMRPPKLEDGRYLRVSEVSYDDINELIR